MSPPLARNEIHGRDGWVDRIESLEDGGFRMSGTLYRRAVQAGAQLVE